MKLPMRPRMVSVCIAYAICSLTTASAQTPPGDETVKLPEFKVTSEKDVSYIGKEALSTTRIAVDLADLPQSVVVLNRAFMDDANPTIMAKALNYVGGGQTGTITWSVDRYMVRGFVGEGDYVDGFRTQTDKNTDLNLIDRIEIIKGPSAIFIGNQSNTVGGVINKISKSPVDYKVGTITAQWGMWDTNRADLDIGGPITADKKLTYRFLLAGQDSDGYFDKTYEKRTSIIPMIGYKFSRTTEAWLKYERFSSHYSAYNGIPLDGRTNAIAAIPRKRNLNEDTPQNWRTDWFDRLWGQITTRPTDFLAARLAFFDSRDTQRRVESILAPTGGAAPATPGGPFTPQYVIPANYTIDRVDPNPDPLTGANVPGGIARTVTAIHADRQPRRELQLDLVFNYKTGPIDHKTLLGLDAIDYPQRVKTYSSGGNSTAYTSSINPFNPTYPGTVRVNFDQPPANYTSRTQEFGKIYALQTVSLLKNSVILNAGASRNVFRFSQYSQNYNQNTGVFAAASQVPESSLYKNLVQYGIVYKPIPNVSIFYGYNQNFSNNGLTPSAPFVLQAPQEGKQKEFGVKTTLFEGRVSLNVNYFDVKQLNNSVPAFPQTTPPSNTLVAGTESKGFDGDFTVQVDRNIDLIGSFAVFDAEVPLPAPWNSIIHPGDGQTHSAIPVNNVSEMNFAFWTRYKFLDSHLRGLSVSTGVSYLDERAITDNNNQVFYGYVPSRWLVDLSFGYETKRFRYGLNIDNVFNKKYIYASRSNQVIVPGTPTNVRVSVTYKFF